MCRFSFEIFSAGILLVDFSVKKFRVKNARRFSCEKLFGGNSCELLRILLYQC